MLILLLSFTILAVTVSAIPDTQVDKIEKRNAHIAKIYRRQMPGCDAECASIEALLACTTTECACPIVNSAGSAAVSVCTSCLQSTQPLVASNITLLAGVCLKCESQCSTTLTAYIQSLACNSTTCACSLFSSVGSTAITTCANCVQPFDPLDATGLLQFVEQCGIGPSSASSAYASASASASSLASSASISGPTSTQVGTSSTSAASPASTASKSAGSRICTDLFTRLFCLAMLGALGFNFS